MYTRTNESDFIVCDAQHISDSLGFKSAFHGGDCKFGKKARFDLGNTVFGPEASLTGSSGFVAKRKHWWLAP